MDAIIIAVSLVETGIDIWAQAAASNKCGRIHISSLVQAPKKSRAIERPAVHFR